MSMDNEDGKPRSQLKPAVPTRWNSLFDMSLSVLRADEEGWLTSLDTWKKNATLNNNTLAILKRFAIMAKPLYLATKELERKDTLASYTMIACQQILKSLQAMLADKETNWSCSERKSLQALEKESKAILKPIMDNPLSLIHIWRCRRYSLCRSRWSPYH